MIRPLRQRHRRVIPVLFLILAVAAFLAVLYRTPSPVVDEIPVEAREGNVEGHTP